MKQQFSKVITKLTAFVRGAYLFCKLLHGMLVKKDEYPIILINTNMVKGETKHVKHRQHQK